MTGKVPEPMTGVSPHSGRPGDQVERAIALAEDKLGARYVWATAGPNTFDCSGFTHWVASQVLGPQDHELRSSHHQFNVWGERFAEPLRGDLVFFDTMGVVVMGNRASHVGFALGDGRFIHAANEDLGVRIDRLDAEWYRPKYIGTRRIFARGEEARRREVEEHGGLRFPYGPIRTRAPWNGEPIGADWALVARWREEIEREAGANGLDPRLIAALMAVETQGIHERDGEVLEVWDLSPQDGPSVGLMQVKPKVWRWLRPDADPYTPEGNIRLGAAVLRHLVDKHGSFENAIALGYHPGTSPNGTTSFLYVQAARGLLDELDRAA